MKLRPIAIKLKKTIVRDAVDMWRDRNGKQQRILEARYSIRHRSKIKAWICDDTGDVFITYPWDMDPENPYYDKLKEEEFELMEIES